MDVSLKNVLKVSKLLYIDKEENIPKTIKNTVHLLIKETYFAHNLKEAIEIYNKKHPNIIISEVNLNDESLLPFLHNLREINHSIPIIITSKNKQEEVLFEAIRLQLIDFLVKPLDINEFIHTLNTTAKHILHHGNVIVSFADGYLYNYIDKSVKKNGENIELTQNESRLLELLVANEGQVMCKEDIERHIWGEEFVTESAFKSLFKRLRDKIGKDSIQNKSGHGYYLAIC